MQGNQLLAAKPDSKGINTSSKHATGEGLVSLHYDKDYPVQVSEMAVYTMWARAPAIASESIKHLLAIDGAFVNITDQEVVSKLSPSQQATVRVLFPTRGSANIRTEPTFSVWGENGFTIQKRPYLVAKGFDIFRLDGTDWMTYIRKTDRSFTPRTLAEMFVLDIFRGMEWEES